MRVALAVAAALGLASIAAADPALAAVKKQTNIPAQELGAALQAFAKERDLQLVYATQEIDNHQTGGAVGELSTSEALTRLLSGTGLTYAFLDDTTITVAPKGSLTRGSSPLTQRGDLSNPLPLAGEGQGGGAQTVEGSGLWNRLRLAQAETGSSPSPASGEGRGEEKLEEYEPTAGKGLPEILVKGSRSLNADIERTKDDIQPYVVLDRELIRSSGTKNIDDLLKQRLTMNYTSLSANQTSAQGLGNESLIALRGLSSTQTLILIDGRRPGANTLGESGVVQPDLNAIPLNAIERIEVLPASSAGIYGGSATGGVVNVILRRDYSGLETILKYENTETNDGATQSIDLAGGVSLGSDTNLLFRGGFADSEGLYGRDRTFFMDRRRGSFEYRFAQNPQLLRSASPVLGATTNISSARVGAAVPDLVLKDGRSLGSPVTTVPSGYLGSSTDAGTGLLQNAGKYNFDAPSTAQLGGAGQSLLGGPTVKSGALTLRHRFAPRVETFFDAMASSNKQVFSDMVTSSQVQVGASAPTNPFNQNVIITTPLFGLNGESRTTSEAYRAVSGVIVSLGRTWQLEADYAFDRTESEQTSPATVLSSQLRSAIALGQLDVFKDTSLSGLDLSSYALPDGRVLPHHSTQNDVTVHLAGSLWSMPAGAATLSILGEWRKEFYGEVATLTPDATGAFEELRVSDTSQKVRSAYAEIRLPVYSELNKIPFVHVLEFQLAARFDQYDRIGVITIDPSLTSQPPQPHNKFSSTDPTLGLRFSPLPDITFRASYGTGFLPPALQFLQASPSFPFPGAVLGLRDPLRGNELLGTIIVANGGNSELDPETSRTTSAGIVLTPRMVPGLRASVDWTKIRKRGEIGTVGLSQDTLNNEPILPAGIITRDPRTAENDPSNFGVGPISGIDIRLLNSKHSLSESLDFDVSYQLSTQRAGTWRLMSAATRLIHSQQQLVVGGPDRERAGTVSAPNWKGNVGVSWSAGRTSVAWTSTLYGRYWLNEAHAVDLNQGVDHIPSRVYHDLVASYRFDRDPSEGFSLKSDLEIQLGVKNILNEAPYYVATNQRFYDQWGDPRQATYFVSLRKGF